MHKINFLFIYRLNNYCNFYAGRDPPPIVNTVRITCVSIVWSSNGTIYHTRGVARTIFFI